MNLFGICPCCGRSSHAVAGSFDSTATWCAPITYQAAQQYPVGHGMTVRWTRFDGCTTTLGTHGHDTWEDAQEAMARMLADSDWTPVRWWKFWRWDDTRFAPATPTQKGKR